MEIRYYASETWWGFNNAGSRVDENDDMIDDDRVEGKSEERNTDEANCNQKYIHTVVSSTYLSSAATCLQVMRFHDEASQCDSLTDARSRSHVVNPENRLYQQSKEP